MLPVAESRTISGLVVRRILNIVLRHDEEVNIINENGILSEDKRSTAMTLVIILMIRGTAAARGWFYLPRMWFERL